MKVIVVGASHWHTGFYVEPLLEMADVEIVAISDPDPAFAAAFASRLGCRGTTDWRELLEGERPDFAFVLGRHDQMAEPARGLIAAGIPFAIEKPAGIDHAEVAELARLAKAADLFVAIPLVFRYSGFMAAIAEYAPGETVHYAGFRFIAGPPARYIAAGCEWMLDPQKSGGGPGLNLGVHFIDLFRLLMPGGTPEIVSAIQSHSTSGLAIDDHSLITLQNGERTCLVETGYLYPAPAGIFDMHFSIRTDRHYFSASGPGRVEISDDTGARRTIEASTTNMPLYPFFVTDTLARFKKGEPPIADLEDMAEIMALADAAYSQSRAHRSARQARGAGAPS